MSTWTHSSRGSTSLFGNRGFSIKALTDFSDLNKDTRRHLKSVYVSLGITMLCAGAGATLYLLSMFQGLLVAAIGSIGMLIALSLTPHNKENTTKRLGMLCVFGFLSGTSLGPLLDAVIAIDPSIVPTAFLGTCIVFVCLTMASLMSERRSYLFLAGPLMSGLSLMLFLSIMSLFTGSAFGLQIQLYLGLLVFCGFVLFDTQMIIERRERGDDDFIWHSVDLFIDFLAIFKRLMIILASKKEKKTKK